MTPLLSVVTLSFNQSRFLERALRSVIEQDYPAIEYVVVDPGSTDGSRAIIDRHRRHIAHAVYQPDTGPADGLNTGLANCTGLYFCYLNSDDFFLPGAFRSAVNHLNARPDIAFVTGDGFIVDENNKPIRRFISAPLRLRRLAYGQAVVCQQSCFFRREAVVRAGGFNKANRVAWDAELLLDIVRSGGRSALVHEYWSAFRLHRDSITSNVSLGPLHKEVHAQFFRRIMNRDPRWYDSAFVYQAKFLRWAVDPIGLIERLKPLPKELTALGDGDQDPR